MASLSMSPQEREAIEAFRRDVIEASVNKPVIVRFTAEWCGPCKQLAPVIDKVVAESGGRAEQVVVDIDQNRLIAEQFKIQSVPTVYAFVNGQPVDGFVGVKPESEIRALLDKLLQMMPPSEEEQGLETHIAGANALLDNGDARQAAEMFAAIARQAPDRADAVAGYARALLALGQVDDAATTLAAIPADNQDPAIQQARSALELAQNAPPSGELQALQEKVATNPEDHEARIAYADALFAAGKRDEGAEQLFASITADREWNEAAARQRLLKHIESIGVGDPWSVVQRRRLSAILFT